LIDIKEVTKDNPNDTYDESCYKKLPNECPLRIFCPAFGQNVGKVEKARYLHYPE